MKREVENIENNNGSYTRKETYTQTPEDGFVPDSIITPNDREAHRRYHKGYRTSVSYTTNDPRITRPFAYGICGLFFTIGVIMSLFRIWIIGIPFIAMSLFAFYKFKRDIDAIAEELEKKGQKVTVESKEEKEQLKKEISEFISDGFEEAKSTTFTKENYKKFLILTIPIFSIIAIAVSLIISIMANIILGLIVFGGFVIIGFIFYFIVSKICKY